VSATTLTSFLLMSLESTSRPLTSCIWSCVECSWRSMVCSSACSASFAALSSTSSDLMSSSWAWNSRRHSIIVIRLSQRSRINSLSPGVSIFKHSIATLQSIIHSVLQEALHAHASKSPRGFLFRKARTTTTTPSLSPPRQAWPSCCSAWSLIIPEFSGSCGTVYKLCPPQHLPVSSPRAGHACEF